MFKDNVLILKNSSILYVRLFLTSILALIAVRYVIQSLGASDYGLYSVVGGIVVMMAFLNTVMVSTTFRYIAFEMGRNSLEGINKVFNISLSIHLFLALLVIALTETAGVYYVKNFLNIEPDKIPDALFVLRFSMLATIFSVVSIPYQGMVTAQEKFGARAAIEILRSILALIAAIVIIFYPDNKLRLYAVLIAFANATPAFLFFKYCSYKYAELVKWKIQKDLKKYKEMLGFSGWIMIGAASHVGKVQGAALIINAFFGTVVNASFAIAAQVNSVVLKFSQNIGQAAIPQITKSYSSGNTDRTLILASHISKYTCFLLLLPALPILLETDFLFTAWLGDVPPYTVILCQLMIINALVESLGAGIPAVVHATGKIKYFQMILSTTSLMSLPIGYLLFTTGFPPYGITIAFITTALINVVVRQILLKKLLNFDVKYFLKTAYLKIAYVVVLSSPLFFIRDMFTPGASRFLLISSLAISWLLAAIYFAGIESKEKEFLKEVIIKFHTKVRTYG